MPGRVLVADDVIPNVKLREAKLSSEYFDIFWPIAALRR